MAVQAAQITSGSGTSASSFTTASVAPVARRLYLLAVSNRKGSTPTPTVPTVSGAGMTWTQIATSSHSADHRLTLFRSLSASPGSGALTISYSGDTQDDSGWHLAEFSTVKTTGANGADAVVQSATNGSGSDTSPFTVTLSAFASVSNATYGTGYEFGTADLVIGSGFTQLAKNTPTGTLVSMWKNTNDTSVDWTFTGNPHTEGIAVEIAAGTSSTMIVGDI
jgi:hypothetical protein